MAECIGVHPVAVRWEEPTTGFAVVVHLQYLIQTAGYGHRSVLLRLRLPVLTVDFLCPDVYHSAVQIHIIMCQPDNLFSS